MSNLDIYREAFITIFKIKDSSSLTELKYQDIPLWDSVGHLELMTHLENKYQIRIDIDDIIDFSSFNTGIKILSKYGIEI